MCVNFDWQIFSADVLDPFFVQHNQLHQKWAINISLLTKSFVLFLREEMS